MEPKRVTSTEFRNRAGQYLDEAAKAPIIITKHSRPSRVLIDFEQYERMKRYDTREYVRVEDLTAEEAEGIATAEIDPRHDTLDHLFD
jgi:prevent-host-death family protein